MIFMGRLVSEVAFIQLPTVILIAAPEHAINTENNSVCITEQGFIPSNLRPAINLPHCNGLLSSEVFSDRKHAHIKTIAATNKNTKSVGVIAVLSNADISTLKAIKQASKMLVKKLGFIEIRRCTFLNALRMR